MNGEKQKTLRLLAGIILLLLIIIVVLVDLFGRLLVDESFRVSDLMLGTLIGGFLLLVGIDVSKRWPFNGGK
jgi:uncharacterized membrane protein YgaE (UPF0421/DUF939 family)